MLRLAAFNLIYDFEFGAYVALAVCVQKQVHSFLLWCAALDRANQLWISIVFGV